MKKTTIMFVLCLIATSIWAAPRSQQQALTEAKAFLSKKGIAKVEKISMSFRAPRKQKASNAASYYVFNMEDNKGFVIVSGDDRISPILGYADSGKFDTENMPEHIKAWMDSYTDQLQMIEEGKAMPRSQKTMKAMSMTKHNIAPLLTCNWSQDEPYSNQCPTYSRQSCVTGCVATAMAQVLYHHRANSVKATLKEIPGYTTSTRRLSLKSIPANSPIDWDNMVDNYTGNETSAQNNAVANLMKYCGYSVQMDYNLASSGGSGAMSELIPEALVNYFGYDKETRLENRLDYSADEWDDLIYCELRDNRPVIYGGAAAGGGHQFVIDGYDVDGLFHVNWGWAGSCNGYFLISVLNPDNNSGIGAASTSDGYSISQSAIIGAQPTETPTEYEYLKNLNGGLNYIDGNNVYYHFYNYNNTTLNLIVLLIAKNEQTGDEYAIAGVNVGELAFLYGSNNYPFEIKQENLTKSNMPAGIYSLKIASMPNDEDYYYDMKLDVLDEAMLDYNGSSFALSIRYAGENLEATGLTTGTITTSSSSMYRSYNVPVNIDIKNNGDKDYCGPIYIFASTSSSMGDALTTTDIVVKKQSATSATLTISENSTGTYHVWISTDAYGGNIIGTYTINVKPSSPATSTLTCNNIKVNNIYSGKNVYGNVLNGYFTVTNTKSQTFKGTLTAKLFYSNSYNETSIDANNMVVTINSNGTAQIPFSFKDLEYGYNYTLRLYNSENGNVVLAEEPNYRCNKGIVVFTDNSILGYAPTTSFTVPENALAVDMSATTTVNSVTPNSNPNTLYYLSNSGSVPAGINSNVIRNNKAENITLSDNYAMYVPTTFTAENISYSRKMEHSTNGTGGWETIVLPFDVDKVVVAESNKQIDWFHSRTDSDKDFWVKSYTQQSDDGTVYFDYATQMDAYIPYIIAVPGNRWGEEWNLQGKTLNFIGEDAVVNADTRAITTADIFGFEGIFQSNSLNNIYNLNDAGTNFGLTADATVPAFRAYFFSRQEGNGPAFLRIAQQGDKPTDDTTGLTFQMAKTDNSSVIYDLQGRRLNMTFGNLPKGIYIVNGKKIVKN